MPEWTPKQSSRGASARRPRPRILFLYSEAMGYTEALLRALVREHDAEVTLVSWDGERKRTPYGIEIAEVETIPRSSLTDASLREIIDSRRPSIMYVSGWMDDAYLRASKYARSRGTRVVAGIDTHWTGSIRQRFSALVLKRFWNAHFDYFWVPGAPQEQYAIRLGFQGRILRDLLSADTDLFAESWQRAKKTKRESYPRRLLFVGRLAPEKGVPLLTEAFLAARSRTAGDWSLVVAGTGPLLPLLPRSEYIEYVGFKTPTQLAALMDDCGAFCLPSLREPWGLVIHESAAAGLPMLVSDACGAAERFVRNEQNGYLVRSGRLPDLGDKLARLMALPDGELMKMAERSHALSKSISPSRSASSLVSVLYQDEQRPHARDDASDRHEPRARVRATG